MADAESVEYVQKEGDFQVGDYVTIVVSQDANGDGKRHVNGIIAGEGTDQMNNVVSGTWNLEIPGWDSLHGKKDENGRPQGGHIYQVRPLACSVPSKDFEHCKLPKIVNVDTLGPKKTRINGDYELGESYEGRPAWYFTCADGTALIMCHKKQKGKPAWLITKKKVLDEGLDGGYALFAQDLWLPSHREYHLRGEVWGTWDSDYGKWVADQSLRITEGAGKKAREDK